MQFGTFMVPVRFRKRETKYESVIHGESSWVALRFVANLWLVNADLYMACICVFAMFSTVNLEGNAPRT